MRKRVLIGDSSVPSAWRVKNEATLAACSLIALRAVKYPELASLHLLRVEQRVDTATSHPEKIEFLVFQDVRKTMCGNSESSSGGSIMGNMHEFPFISFSFSKKIPMFSYYS